MIFADYIGNDIVQRKNPPEAFRDHYLSLYKSPCLSAREIDAF